MDVSQALGVASTYPDVIDEVGHALYDVENEEAIVELNAFLQNMPCNTASDAYMENDKWHFDQEG